MRFRASPELELESRARPAGALRLERLRFDPAAGLTLERLDGYIIPNANSAHGMIHAPACVWVMSALACRHVDAPQSSPFGSHLSDRRFTQNRPMARPVPIPHQRVTATLRPVRSGEAFRIVSPPRQGLVRPELARQVEIVFENFARTCNATPEEPLQIRLARGFQSGSPGHGEGRALDILAVGGKPLRPWKHEWDEAIKAAEKISDEGERARAIAAEQKRNLGFGLYKALQTHGDWRVNKGGWPVYRHIMQLFGPWTETEGPWKAMHIENPNPYQRQRLADQKWVFRAHQDHIHVAR